MFELEVLNESNDVSCDGCGACCLHMSHPMYYSKGCDDNGNFILDYPEGMPEELKRSLDDGGYSITDPDTPCIWLDLATRQCRHYEWRPPVCREFELGGDDCLRIRQEVRDRGWTID